MCDLVQNVQYLLMLSSILLCLMWLRSLLSLPLEREETLKYRCVCQLHLNLIHKRVSTEAAAHCCSSD